ncbi:MAG: hypothetical protein JWP89_1682 [Schlesneria sp.]|nr:hypothetical protein [Schlesneria sp.]
MTGRRLALVAQSLALILTLWLISEAFVSYAETVTARDIQRILQTKILCLGSLTAILQVAAGLAILTDRKLPDAGNSSQ